MLLSLRTSSRLQTWLALYTPTIMMLFSLLFVRLVAGHTSDPEYVITLNKTDSATVFCFSDYLNKVRIITPRCATCEARVLERASSTCNKSAAHLYPQHSHAKCNCDNECRTLQDDKCPFRAGENTACLSGVKSGVSGTRVQCVGILSNGGNLTVTIQIVAYNGTEICYGANSGLPMKESELLASGMKMRDTFNKTYYTKETRNNLQIVKYDSPVMCVNSSSVNMLTAGHLVAAGYILDSKPIPLQHGHYHKRMLSGEDKTYMFDKFCVLDRPRLWKIKEGFKKGTKYQCNGTLHVLNDEFPCLRFPPVSESFKLPSLENCSTGHMIGIVLAMIIATVVGYIVVIGTLKLMGCICRIASTEKEQLPLATADSSTTETRLTLMGSVVKQVSIDSLQRTRPPFPPSLPIKVARTPSLNPTNKSQPTCQSLNNSKSQKLYQPAPHNQPAPLFQPATIYQSSFTYQPTPIYKPSTPTTTTPVSTKPSNQLILPKITLTDMTSSPTALDATEKSLQTIAEESPDFRRNLKV